MADKDNIRCFKFMFEAVVGRLSLAVKFPCMIKVLWKRSGEVAQIEPTALENGSITFNKKLSLNVNMYFDIVNKHFLEKKSVFSLILVTPKGEKSAGSVSVDLATKLNEHVEEYFNVYPLEKCPVSGSSLEISIKSNIIAEKTLDSMSQITTAPQTAVDTSALETSGMGDSILPPAHEQHQEIKSSSAASTQQTDLLNFESSKMTDNILKINDTTAKIGQFVAHVGAHLRVEMEKLREANKLLTQQLQTEKSSRAGLEGELSKVKLENENSKSQLTIIAEQHQKSLDSSMIEKSQLQQKLESAQKMKSSLETASMSGDQEKLQYINALKQQHEEDSQRFDTEKTRLQGLLKAEQEQVLSLRTLSSELTNQLKATKETLQQVSVAKRELESERKDNEQEVEAARVRLQKVYEEMLSALNLQGATSAGLSEL